MYSTLKSISDDFTNGVRASVLHEEIVSDAAIATELLGVTAHGDVCQIDFSTEPAVDEKTQLDAIIAAHSGVETLAEAKIRIIKTLDGDIRRYVERDDNYPPHRQRSLMDLMVEAKIDGLTNRYAYVAQFKSWVFTEVMAYYYQKEAEIEACTSIQSVEAVTWNPAKFDATNPHVTIAQTMAIED